MNTKIILLISAGYLLSGCAVAKTTGKVVAAPVKVAAKTTELAGKGIYYTGKGAAIGTYKTGEFIGKGAYYTGKGVYNTAKVPVTILNGALDTTQKILTVTTQAVDLTGKVVTVTRQVQRSEIDSYVSQAQAAGNVLSVVIDAFRG